MPKKKKPAKGIPETPTEEAPKVEVAAATEPQAASVKEEYVDSKTAAKKLVVTKRVYNGKNQKYADCVYVGLSDGTERLLSPDELAADGISLPEKPKEE